MGRKLLPVRVEHRVCGMDTPDVVRGRELEATSVEVAEEGAACDLLQPGHAAGTVVE